MTGEVVTLREYVEQALAGHDRVHVDIDGRLARLTISHGEIHHTAEQAHKTEHALIQTALERADRQLELRLDLMNGVRSQLTVQAESFVTRLEMDARSQAALARDDSTRQRVAELEKRNANLDGKIAMLGIGLTVLIVLVNLGLRLVSL